MSWKDKLRPASFRGVPFHVTDDDMAAGRRVQVHEYPQRDKPYAEDLGRATRDIRLSAFVIGADYLAARDRLLEAIEQPGPGTLVHPWYGSMQVVVTECRVTHSSSDGGKATFSLTFVEAGELTFPRADSLPQAQSRLAADALSASSVDDFAKKFTVDGAPAYVFDSALKDVLLSIGLVRSGLASVSQGFTSRADSLTGSVAQLLGTPRELGAAIASLFTDIKSAKTNLPRLGVALLNLLGEPSLKRPALTPVTNSGRMEAGNMTAIRALMRRSIMSTAAHVASNSPVPVYEDAIAMRDKLTTAMDEESHTASDTVFNALTDLRVQVRNDLTTRARDSARLKAFTPREIVPAVVIAYDLYEDATRDGELVQRNRIAHPGFVPPAPLLVVSR